MKHNWEYKKLGEVCEVLNGYAFKSSNYIEDNGLRIIRITNVQDGEIIDDDPKFYPLDQIEELSKYILKKDDLLISLTGNVGRVGLISKSLLPAALNQRVACLRSTTYIPRFLFWYFRRSAFQDDCIKSAKGVAQLNMSTEWLKEYYLPILNAEMQERIVAELDKINEVIEECRELLRTLDSLAQSIFYDTFGDPISNPKGWEKVTLNEVCNKITDGTHNSPKNEPKGDYMYVTAKNIKKSGIVLDDITYIDKDTHRMIYNRCNPEFGDVLYIKDGVTTGIATINQLHEEFSLLSSVALLKPSERINNQYLKSVLNTPSLYNSFRKNMGGAAITRLTISKIQKSSIPVPPLSLQQQFAAQIEAIEAQKNAVEATISELKTLLDSRMDYWFNE